jgi:hypothetical protein
MRSRPGLRTALAAGLAVGAVACISFDIRRFPDPENALASFCVCKRVESEGELLKPAEEKAEFGAADERILAFVGVRNVVRNVRLRWKWYDPARALARDTGEVEVNPEAKSLEIVTAYDVLTREAGTTGVGAWTVVLFIDGRLAARRGFSISGEDGS